MMSSTPMTPLCVSWYSCALATSSGPVHGVSVADDVAYAPLRVPPSVLVARPPSVAEPCQMKPPK